MQTTMYQTMYEPDEAQPQNTLRVDDDGDVYLTFEEPKGGTMQVVMSQAQFRAFRERVTRAAEKLAAGARGGEL